MPRDFYPMVEEQAPQDGEHAALTAHPARIAVYDDVAAAPRVVVIEPKGVREFLEEITGTVNRLSHEQGGTIPFMVIREIVENFVHAYFLSPTITILDGGNTIRFSDQGPGIREKNLALEYGTSSATEEMRKYIRGVGSGLPYAQQYMEDKGGSLTIEDNIQGGTVVTISVRPREEARDISRGPAHDGPASRAAMGGVPAYPAQAGSMYAGQPMYQAPAEAQAPWQQGWPQPWQQQAPQGWPQQPAQGWPQQGYPQPAQAPAAQQPHYQQQPMLQPSAQPMAQPFYQQGYPQGAAPQPLDPASPQQPAAEPGAAGAAAPALSERGWMIIEYLAANGSCGPTDLANSLGYSGPTWSRELAALVAAGYVTKRGQKHYLTAVGAQLTR